MTKDIIKFVDGLDDVVKLLLCIPVLNIVFSVYKLCRSLESKEPLWIILGVLVIFPGAAFMWIVDLVCLLLNRKIFWFC